MGEDKVLIVVCKDLSCYRCHNKMNKIFSRHKDKLCITKIVWDVKCNKIILSGSFNPEELQKKLCCLACRIIIDFEIPPSSPPPPPPPPKPPAPPPPPPPPPTNVVYMNANICICGKPKPPKDEIKTCSCSVVVCRCNVCTCEKPAKPEPPPPPPPQGPIEVKCTCVCKCEKEEKTCHKDKGCDGGNYWDPCWRNYGNPTCQLMYEDAPNGCNIM